MAAAGGIASTMVNLPRDPIVASIGVAQWLPGSSAKALLASADQALLAAKTSGGGAVIAASSLTALTVTERPWRRDRSRERQPIGQGAVQLSVPEVLGIVRQFEPTGGASIELVAWELSVDLKVVAGAWSRAVREGFLEGAGIDEASGEKMWRLSGRGRSRNLAGERR